MKINLKLLTIVLVYFVGVFGFLQYTQMTSTNSENAVSNFLLFMVLTFPTSLIGIMLGIIGLSFLIPNVIVLPATVGINAVLVYLLLSKLLGQK